MCAKFIAFRDGNTFLIWSNMSSRWQENIIAFFTEFKKTVVQLMLTFIFLQLPYEPLPFPHHCYTDARIKRGWKTAVAKQLRIFPICYQVRVRSIHWFSVAQRTLYYRDHVSATPNKHFMAWDYLEKHQDTLGVGGEQGPVRLLFMSLNLSSICLAKPWHS